MMTWYKEADRKTRRVFWTCSAGWALDSADSVVYSFLTPLLMAGLGMTLTQASSIASANFFSAAVGGWLGGWLCDRFGRARILQLTIAWFSFFSFASGFAHSYEQMLIIRVLQGIGFGAEWAVGAVLLGEMINPKHRGKALGTVQSGAAIGSGLAALLAGPFAAMFDPDLGWRIVFWIGIAPALLIFFVRRESDDSDLFKQAQQRNRELGRKTSLADVFKPNILRITIFAGLLSLGVQGAAYSISNFLTPFLHNERGLPIATAGFCILFNSAGGFFGFLTNAYASDNLGRRMVFRLFSVGFIIAASVYLFAPLGSSVPVLMAVGFVYGFFQFGSYASFGPYFTELFPTELRGTGQAFAYNFGRGGSAIFFTGVAMVAATGVTLSTAMATFAISAACCAILSTFFLPETAGRALIGIDDLTLHDGAEGVPPQV
ncbi:MFS transporter [Sphingobium nicotianae]|uniref:MFS transporter n=1 Tax=Sphingobium nicotianae TaxID=2782607 RepID=A0A9X1IRI2_9SPHN|nr:MFS transporter [Sphingobium nicotianae]MBT2187468.1 MFS transporter [Sphingobium nicotianae]